MRRKITVFIIIGVCYLLQTTFFDTLSFASISPNLLIIVTSSFGFMRGRKEGLFIGFFCFFTNPAANRINAALHWNKYISGDSI